MIQGADENIITVDGDALRVLRPGRAPADVGHLVWSDEEGSSRTYEASVVTAVYLRRSQTPISRL